MKRPEGFDQARRPMPPARPPVPPPAAQRPAAKGGAAKGGAARAEKKTTDKPSAPSAGKAPRPPKVVHQAAKSAPVEPEYSARAEARAAAHAARQARRELTRATKARRKFERGESRRFTRRSRNRKVTLGVVAGLLVLLVGMLAVAVFSPILSLREIRVDGASQLDEAEVLAAVDDQVGTPLALVDFARITRNLGTIPLIRSYVTETVPPDTLVIHIVEREAVGIVKVGDEWSIVDAAGVELSTSGEKPEGFPRITVAGDAIGNPAFAEATEVLLALPDDLRARVQTISASTDSNVRFTLQGASGQKVVWGNSDDSDVKAEVFAGMYKECRSSGEGTYDVSSTSLAIFDGPNQCVKD